MAFTFNCNNNYYNILHLNQGIVNNCGSRLRKNNYLDFLNKE